MRFAGSNASRSRSPPSATTSPSWTTTIAKPADWGDPEASLDRRQFFDAMDLCLEKLPPNAARAFMLREVMELETDEICKELAITANNLWVILYRARMSLRQCLEKTWFADKSVSP
jgi:RNA polymerase sigma-70 factor (ECF subfamily)